MKHVKETTFQIVFNLRKHRQGCVIFKTRFAGYSIGKLNGIHLHAHTHTYASLHIHTTGNYHIYDNICCEIKTKKKNKNQRRKTITTITTSDELFSFFLFFF